MDLRFGTWYVRGLCRVSSLETVASELAEYNLDLDVRGQIVQELHSASRRL
jgi:hypothetical protein